VKTTMAMESIPAYAAAALALSVKNWTKLGVRDGDAATTPTSDLSILVERITSLLLIRCVAVVAPPHAYADLSTTTICRTALMRQEPWAPPITEDVISQLKCFVHSILSRYNDVPYHNREHAFHVVLSCNKLVDLMLQEKTPTFGLRNDPLALFSLMFAALIHDVEHLGLPNRQLSGEGDALAVLYNDQSIAENRSLYLAFAELLKDEYKDLRGILFHGDSSTTIKEVPESYHRFRKQVIQLVLGTDIASPERTQLAKSKFKEAFGTVVLTMEQGGDDNVEDVEEEVVYSSEEDEEEHVIVEVEEAEDESGTGNVAKSEDEIVEIKNDTEEENKVGDDEESPSPYLQQSDLSPVRRHRQQARYSAPSTSAFTPTMIRTYRRGSRRYSQTTLEREPSFQNNRRSSTGNPRVGRSRLGIRMSMDLSGEALENYSRVTGGSGANWDEDEEPDELKVSVVLELILTAADVAHNLQGWSQMVKWSGRLYMELQRAFLSGRGGDPQTRWYENQIGFLEMYLLPLAKHLDDTGVFGDSMGKIFAEAVVANRDKWLRQGLKVTREIVAAAEKMKAPVIQKPSTEAANPILADILSGSESTPKQDNTKFCMFCGKSVPSVAKFCPGCGEKQEI
jgi:hypothetical protein